ncbi:MAG: hypothetical protein FWE91_12435 [Defluviitaleaceae bacterium]|nr:hypothetical protein [Defluviitaleaceae bacterium]MCL2836655.1 hypothetical protein [Defluviitaleaceae bacterium]
MLTNVYYYNIYQPFIMQRQSGPDKSAKSVLSTYAGNASGHMRPGAQVTRNTSMKRDVSDFVGAVCRNVTEMRDCAKYLSLNTESYYVNVLHESFDKSKQWVEEDVSMFVNAYNTAVSFGMKQEHSPELTRYAGELKDIALSYNTLLDGIGVSVHRDGDYLSFSPGKIHDLDFLAFGHSVSGAAQAANAVYERTVELLQLPAAAHMDFRQLSFYYNYRVDRSPEEAIRKTPSYLHSGLVLDKAI